MTQEFIKTQCINCDKCIFERDGGHHFYPYPMPNDYIPMYCGSITEFGCHGISLTDLEHCPKEHPHDMMDQIPPLKQLAILQTEEGKKQTIDKACEWLGKNIINYRNWEYNEFHDCVEYDGSFDIEKMISDFRKAMEEHL